MHFNSSRRRWISILALFAACTILLTGCPGKHQKTRGGAQPAFPVRAAFYNSLYPESWTTPGTNYNPALGNYDINNRTTVAEHIAGMQYGGIQVGIASWAGQGSPTDARVSELTSVADAINSNFKWALYYQAEGISDPAASQISSDLTYIKNNYTGSDAYYKVGGKPVIFVTADANDGCPMADRWATGNNQGFYTVLKVFGGFGACANQPDNWHQYSATVATDGQGTHSYSISPGFYPKGGSIQLSRDTARWASSISSMVASGANFQLITSFNNWGEGSAVEPADEWQSGTGWGAYLDALHNNGGGAPPATTSSPPPTTSTPPPATGTSTFVTSQRNTQASGSSISIPKPTAVANGDVLITAVTTRTGSSSTISAPGGWVQVSGQQNNSTTLATGVFYRVASNDTGPYVFAVGNTTGINTVTEVFRGVNTTSPVLAGAGRNSGASSGTSVIVPALTVGAAEMMKVAVAGVAVASTINAPAGFTEPSLGDSSEASGQTLEMSYLHDNTANPPQVTATANTAGVNSGFQIALNDSGNSGAPVTTTTPPVTTTPAPPSTVEAVVGGAGDIACDTSNSVWQNGDNSQCQAKAVGSLLSGLDAVFTLGDDQYESGAITPFNTSYNNSWGPYKSITHPTAGNHEYGTSGASGYFTYFGSRGNAPDQPSCTSGCKGYYSWNIGTNWHFVALNSGNCTEAYNAGGPCGAGQAQETWLANDLAANSRVCTVAYWHHPRFSSGQHNNETLSQAWWTDLYNANVDIVLNGHDHDYERFAPLDTNGNIDNVRGIREFIVGTGGKNHYNSISTGIKTGSQVHNGSDGTNATYGILKLTLHPNSYDFQFVPAVHSGNGNFTDSGSGIGCH